MARVEPGASLDPSVAPASRASPGGTGTASLSGSGLAPASLSISPTSFTFPTVLTFDAGSLPLETFLVTNGGDTPSATLAATLVAGPGTVAGDFAIAADSCSGGLLTGMSTCDVTVRFQPSTRGAKSATLKVNGSAPTASLTGAAQDQVALSVTTGGAGSGTVVDGAGLLSCPGTCAEEVVRGITTTPTVTLTATPGSGSVFTGWTGACSGTTPTCAVTMSTSQSVGAQFGLAPVTLSFTMTSFGPASQSVTSTPAGIHCAAGRSCTTSTSYNVGTSVVLSVPAGGTGLEGGGGDEDVIVVVERQRHRLRRAHRDRARGRAARAGAAPMVPTFPSRSRRRGRHRSGA